LGTVLGAWSGVFVNKHATIKTLALPDLFVLSKKKLFRVVCGKGSVLFSSVLEERKKKFEKKTSCVRNLEKKS